MVSADSAREGSADGLDLLGQYQEVERLSRDLARLCQQAPAPGADTLEAVRRSYFATGLLLGILSRRLP